MKKQNKLRYSNSYSLDTWQILKPFIGTFYQAKTQKLVGVCV